MENYVSVRSEWCFGLAAMLGIINSFLVLCSLWTGLSWKIPTTVGVFIVVLVCFGIAGVLDEIRKKR